MEIINKFVNYFCQLMKIRYQNKGYDLLSVNIEMRVMLGIPIMNYSHPNINLCLSFLRININKSTRYWKYALYDKQKSFVYVRISRHDNITHNAL